MQGEIRADAKAEAVANSVLEGWEEALKLDIGIKSIIEEFVSPIRPLRRLSVVEMFSLRLVRSTANCLVGGKTKTERSENEKTLSNVLGGERPHWAVA